MTQPPSFDGADFHHHLPKGLGLGKAQTSKI
jgi:hypothetical protein